MDYLEKYTKYVIENAKSAQALQELNVKLETTTAELRRMKIDILKKRKQKRQNKSFDTGKITVFRK